MSRVHVRILSGGFVVTPTSEMFATFTGYLYRMYRYEYAKVPVRQGGRVTYVNKNELKEKWSFESPTNNEYRIHISYLEDFRRYFSNFDIHYEVVPWCFGDDVEIEMKDFYSPREKQGDWIEFLTTEDGPHLSLPATMGGGKTVTFLACCAAIKKRAAAIIPPFLSDRWLYEINKFTTLDKKEYIYISGSDLLKRYMATIEAGLNPFKIVLFSINTIRNYIRDYYEFPEGWIYSPEEFFMAAGFGVKGVDEAHKELHFHFQSNLFMNMGRYINLSGTLGKENPFLNEMAERNYPLEDRCPVDEAEAVTVANIYKMYYTGYIPQHRSPMGYSHVIYENNIRYRPSMKNAYFMYLARILFAEFVSIRSQPMDKCLVFMATTKLADEFCDFLKADPNIYTHFDHLLIDRLRAGEPDDKCRKLNIAITTIGRAGTGFDVEGVLTVLNTIAINDQYLQRQVLGRGRKRDDVDCRYVRVYSPHIQKHVDYHLKSLAALRDLCKTVKIHELPGAMPFPTSIDMQVAKEIEGAERREKKLKKSQANERKRNRANNPPKKNKKGK